jgi:hypothetical protein
MPSIKLLPVGRSSDHVHLFINRESVPIYLVEYDSKDMKEIEDSKLSMGDRPKRSLGSQDIILLPT